jgi:galactose-1-phosphate uridylyltransferase
MPYSAVTVIGSKHFVGLSEFTADMLADAFLASQTYLKRVQEYDLRAKYCYITWNYMPPANSSQIHPHLQVLAGHFPLAYHQVLLDASKKYRNENGAIFWSDFIAEERKLQERYITTIGNTVWLTSFVPRCFQSDIQVIFQGRESVLALSHQDIRDFAEGLTRVFKHMDDQNSYSFNLCLYSGMAEDSFWTQARIIERGLLPPLGISDIGHMFLADTRISAKRPEVTCQELKPYFAQKGKNKEK